MQGIRLTPPVRGQGCQVIQRLQQIARDPPACDGLIKDPKRVRFLIVQVERGCDA